MKTLDQIAGDLVYLLADDMDDEEHDLVAAMSSEDQVRHCYVGGECDAFAVALHRITGWPVVGVTSDLGPIHRLVQAPNGRLLDAAGWTDLEALSRRYDIHPLRLVAGVGEDGILAALPGPDESGVDPSLADAVAAIRQLPWAPFSDADFRIMSAALIEGADPATPAPSI